MRYKCGACGASFASSGELKEHSNAAHNFADEKESSLLRRAGEEEKARRRTRGPYRKSHAA